MNDLFIWKPTLLVWTGLFLFLVQLLLGFHRGFDVFWIGLSLLLGGFLGMLFQHLIPGLIFSILLVLVYFTMLRHRLAVWLMPVKKTQSYDWLINLPGKTKHRISQTESGYVYIRGSIWPAKSKTPINQDVEVVATHFDGKYVWIKKRKETRIKTSKKSK